MATFAILAFLVGILLIVTPGLVVTILVTLANDVQTVDRVLSVVRIMIKESGASAQTKEVGFGVTRVRNKSG